MDHGAIDEVLRRGVDIDKAVCDLKLGAHDKVREVDHKADAVFGSEVVFADLEQALRSGTGVGGEIIVISNTCDDIYTGVFDRIALEAQLQREIKIDRANRQTGVGMLTKYSSVFECAVSKGQGGDEAKVKIFAELPVGYDAEIEAGADAWAYGADGVIIAGERFADNLVVSHIDAECDTEIYLLASQLVDVEAFAVAGFIAVWFVEVHDLAPWIYFVGRLVSATIAIEAEPHE